MQSIASCHMLSSWRTSISRMGLFPTTYFRLYLSGNAFILPWYFKHVFLDIIFLVDCIYFSFNTLNTSVYFLLASIVPGKKSAKFLFRVLLYMRRHYSLGTFNTLSLGFSVLLIICLSVVFLIFILLGFCWASFTYRLIFVIKLEIFFYYLFQ